MLLWRQHSKSLYDDVIYDEDDVMYVYMFVAMQEAEGMASGCVEWGEVRFFLFLFFFFLSILFLFFFFFLCCLLFFFCNFFLGVIALVGTR